MTRTSRSGATSARLRLVTGYSSVSLRELEGPAPRWLRLGESPDADWRVHAEGVAPDHCELLWDGRALYVQDRLRLGSTYVGNQRVSDWLVLPDRSMLRVGGAVLWVESPACQPQSPDPRALRWMQAQAERIYAKRRSSSPALRAVGGG